MNKVLKVLALGVFLISFAVQAQAAAPVLHFSDIISGPSSGLGDGLGEGAIVTVWGNNLGSIQGASTITIGGQAPAHIYYWKNADGQLPGGPANLYESHKMQEIAFSIPATLADGLYDIQVTVSGVISNTTPFTVRAGNIYYISTIGNSGNSGSWAAPWAAVDKDTAGSICNQGSFNAGDIVYVKDTVSEADVDIRYKIGTLENPMALVSYPGGRYTVTSGGFSNYFPYVHHFWSIGKLKVVSEGTAISPAGGWRVIANEITDINQANGEGGAISTNGDQGLKNSTAPIYCYGNYIHDFGGPGTSSKHHVFYISNRGKDQADIGNTQTYACKLDHISSAATQPGSGADWHTYWETSDTDPTLGTISTWSSGVAYDSGKVFGFELGWNRLEDNMARNGLHVYDEHECGDYYGTISIHDNFVRNQAGAAVNIGVLAPSLSESACITAPIDVFNNVIINASQTPFTDYAAVSLYGTDITSHVRIYNNTIYSMPSDANSFISVNGAGGATAWDFGGTWEFKNNILYNDQQAYWEPNGFPNKTPVSSTNNLWYTAGTGNPASPPAWDSSVLIENDPLLISATNFHLQSTSPAKDAGVTIADVIADIDGLSRPQGLAYDIGAYEYSDTTCSNSQLNFCTTDISCFKAGGNFCGAICQQAPCTIGLAAFPGAEGGGASTIGGRGGMTMAVTNLNKSGVGSFKAALEATMPRTVIFKVAGTIDMEGEGIVIRHPYLTIAGQTAPNGGVTIKNSPISVVTDNIIIRYLRFRLGSAVADLDGISLSTDSHDIIIDHCSFSWATDENIGIYSLTTDPYNITISNSIIGEGLSPHSCGVLTGGRLTPINMRDIDFHHNLFISNAQRNPQITIGSSRLINNLVHNWGQRGFGLSGGVNVDIVGNKFKIGQDIGPKVYEIKLKPYGDEGNGPTYGPTGSASVYIKNNIGPNQSNPLGDDWGMMSPTVNANSWTATMTQPDRANVEKMYELPMEAHPITIQNVTEIETPLLTSVGNSRRINYNGRWIDNRDSVDVRLVNEYSTGTGKIIANESEVGGYPVLSVGITPIDTDNDGIPDIYEDNNGLDKTNDADAALDSGNGYTNLESFFNMGLAIYADVDQNSTINSTDALLTLRNSLGLTMSSTNWQDSSTTGDVNCDNSSNATDALLILRSSLGLDMSGTGWCVS